MSLLPRRWISGEEMRMKRGAVGQAEEKGGGGDGEGEERRRVHDEKGVEMGHVAH